MSLFKVAMEQANAKRDARILLSVPGSASVDLMCRTVTAEDISRCQKGGKRLFPKDDILAGNQTNRALLATCCTEIWQDGVTTVDGNGDTVTFTDKATQEELKVATASEAVLALIGRDGDVNALASELLRQSGFDEYGAPLSEADAPT